MFDDHIKQVPNEKGGYWPEPLQLLFFVSDLLLNLAAFIGESLQVFYILTFTNQGIYLFLSADLAAARKQSQRVRPGNEDEGME